MKKVELLAPAGNLEKLKLAILYGADAVYCGGLRFGLRYGADNFTPEELEEGTRFVHNHGGKIYITVNIYPHNNDLAKLPDYLHKLEEIGVDGLIVSDPGVIEFINREKIEIPLHLSTQANTVNWASASFWHKQGIERIILARELSREEIKEIRDRTSISLEMFVHGSMCISYSGRCLLSNYMVGRDANRGKCAHPCRWKYHLVEEQRPGEYYPVYENEQGTFIMNSKDLCLIEYLPDVISTGVDSLKIEGRMKSLHYVATVTRVYRKAIDSYYHDPENFKVKPEWLDELKKVSHRGYTTGFFISPPTGEDHNYNSSVYIRDHDFMGIIRDYDKKKNEAVVEVRHKFFKGDRVEVMGPDTTNFETTVNYIINENGEEVDEAPHPRELIRIPVTHKVKPYYLVRRKKS
ncbi:peptidase U32 family protein [Halothermothrix orenii]|uniref:Peptidase U32 n=1 Tax=Halothermothrix orenii (strain H 168 / OCM 544 / DSM 9562) TaxID=373903 RepID=B8D2B4_HALOH|nr:U32 family peptidase [Halothermothrix orenii]ACL69341.1 peptidase U32 [Halothermothrix orenii H 168]